jgi:hypothetical protein
MPDQHLKDNDPMPWGKYEGRPMIEVPADYLLWLHDNNYGYEPVTSYIKENYDVLLSQSPKYQLLKKRIKKL